MKRFLLLGCGRRHGRRIFTTGTQAWDGELVKVDLAPNVGADLVWDLEQRPLPFPDEHFDEIHAYDVLEHIGRQGDWRGWFDECAEYHRLLKPGGRLCVIVPIGGDHFADPGHTRFFDGNHFGFLDQRFYENEAATDYRWYWKLQFSTEMVTDIEGHHLAVIVRKDVA